MQLRRCRARIAGSMLGLIVVGAAGLVIAEHPQKAAAQTSSQMQFFGPDGSGFERFVDVGKKGYSSGDDTYFKVDLIDTSTDAVAGNAVGICTALKPSPANTLQRCEFQANLDGGSILAIASFKVATLEAGAALAIVGGTGAYNSAAGTLTFTSTERDGATGALIDIDLVTHP